MPLPFKKDINQREVVPFKLASSLHPKGDQPKAIAAINRNLEKKVRFQTLQGITGSGKTFTMANVIQKQNKPALVIAPNKTLAAQLYAEFKQFFPENKVKYFVSYYDYYQPEAYIPSTDTYIAKDSAINDEIDKMRHSATKSLLEATDVIIVASISCIYGLGAPEDYFNLMLYVEVGEHIPREAILKQLVYMQYTRSDIEFKRGTFRVRGEVIDIFPSDQDQSALRLLFFGDEIEEIQEIDTLTGSTIRKLKGAAVYPVSHFLTSQGSLKKAIVKIKAEMQGRVKELEKLGKIFEAERLEQRTLYDVELLEEIGFCSGIENYSRHLAGRQSGQPPTTLLDYFSKDFILFIDESHVTVPQIGGMYRGDRSRKQSLVDFGFRLPSALDNRPLNFEEFWDRVGQTVFVSATPSEFELKVSDGHIVEQINRPTGLLDPPVSIRPATHQIDDLLGEVRKAIEKSERVLVTTLTKKMAEDLSIYFLEAGIKAKYLHADINTVERVELIRGLRQGEFDVLIGINLLREGLDLVEVALVAILDADKEGFLRSTRSLIQTIGRAARNLHGRVILYADKETDSIKQAIAETERRRAIQLEYNKKNGIVPESAKRTVERSLAQDLVENDETSFNKLEKEILSKVPKDSKGQKKYIESLRKEMFDAAAKKEFERAAHIRDQITMIQKYILITSENSSLSNVAQ
jgi:excinuclease ABC subunit B